MLPTLKKDEHFCSKIVLKDSFQMGSQLDYNPYFRSAKLNGKNCIVLLHDGRCDLEEAIDTIRCKNIEKVWIFTGQEFTAKEYLNF